MMGTRLFARGQVSAALVQLWLHERRTVSATIALGISVVELPVLDCKGGCVTLACLSSPVPVERCAFCVT